MRCFPLLFRDDFDFVGNNERGVETNSELTNDVVFNAASAFFLEILHEFFGAWLGNST